MLRRFVIVVSAACVLLSGGLAAEAGITAEMLGVPRKASARNVAVYKTIEWKVAMDRSYTNPFNPDEIAVDATFTAPDGSTMTIPAFWYQEYKGANVGAPLYNGTYQTEYQAVGSPYFRVRFTPTKPGLWKMSISATDSQGTRTFGQTPFFVSGSSNRGFVQRTPGNSRYFQFSNGTPFFMVGSNTCWAWEYYGYENNIRTPGTHGTGPAAAVNQFAGYFSGIHNAEGNFARVWLQYPRLEQHIGTYDLSVGYYFDQVLKKATQYDVYVMLTIDSAGNFSTSQSQWDSQIPWDNYIYNSANGGPISSPSAFTTNADCKKYYKRLLRYITARYAAFTHFGFLEYWNEVEGGGSIPGWPAWFSEMSAYVRSVDPYDHLLTVSYSGQNGDSNIWNLSQIDLCQRHDYGSSSSPIVNSAGVVATNVSYFQSHYSKPFFEGEMGIDNTQTDDNNDVYRLHTYWHNAMWASACSGGAGGSGSWWWDWYIDPDNWNRLTGLAKFSKSVDWPRRSFATLSGATTNPSGLSLYGLTDSSNGEAVLWMLDPDSNWQNDNNEWVPTTWNVTLSLPVAKTTAYTVYWWDTRTGAIVRTDTGVTPSGGKLTLTAPSFQRDIALHAVTGS